MSTQNQSDLEKASGTVDDILDKIKEKTADSNYIFRGESQCYERVSSGLYRKLKEVGLLDLGVETLQTEELKYVKKYGYTQKTDEFEILTEIQHFSGKTNLLDFTTDYHIAIFFACDSSPFKDGRIILQNRGGVIKDWIIEPCDPDPKSRVRVQKSIFVRPPDGFIKPHEDDIVTIPASLKQRMLGDLRNHHNISAETIYPDLHGFVSSQDARWNIYEDISKGNDCLENGQEADVHEKKIKNYQKAIEHFTDAIDNAIQLDEGLALAYDGRGSAYLSIGELDGSNGNLENAIEDFTEAIKHKSINAVPYNSRGRAYFTKGELENAVADFNKAIELMPRFAAAHHNRGLAYFFTGKFVLATREYTEAIQLKLDKISVYYDRGVAWLHLQEWEKAKADLIHAKSIGVNITSLFCNFYKSLAKCERVVGAELPEDIAVMLTQP